MEKLASKYHIKWAVALVALHGRTVFSHSSDIRELVQRTISVNSIWLLEMNHKGRETSSAKRRMNRDKGTEGLW